MWAAIRETYAEAWRVAAALPLVAALAIGFELLQHAVEWSIGMYASRASAVAVQADPLRLASGLAKVLVLLLVVYWVARFRLSGSRARTFAPDPAAMRLYVPVVLYTLVVAAVPFLIGAWLPGRITNSAVAGILAVWLVVTFLLDVGLSLWFAGSAAGDARASFGRSLSLAPASLLWGVAVTLAVVLPAMALHYVIGIGAVGKAAPVAAVMLAVDAVFVGLLSLLIGSVRVTIARRMAARAGFELSLT